MLVFRKELYFKDKEVEDKSDFWKELCVKWANGCDGRSKEELKQEGHVILNSWCEDVGEE